MSLDIQQLLLVVLLMVLLCTYHLNFWFDLHSWH
jgi:hypothetical protein